MYNKLFTKILDSSIWLEDDATRLVWLTLIAVMDEDGFCQFASVPNVAHRARVSVEAAQKALSCLESPDPNSSDPANEGRRLERVPGGWVVLNAEKHRRMITRAVVQEQTRERVRRFRDRLVKRTSNASVTPSETETETETRSESVHVQPTRAQAQGALAGTLPRDHMDHGFCGPRFCVSSKICSDMARRYGANGEAAVQAWLQTLSAGLMDDESVGGPVWVLQRFDSFLAASGRVSAAPSKRTSEFEAMKARLLKKAQS
jgi:hypothetical protein